MKCSVLRNQGFPLHCYLQFWQQWCINLIYLYRQSKEIVTIFQIEGVVMATYITVKFRAYIFQRPFLRGLFLEGLIFRGGFLWKEICISKSIGLAL